MVVDTVEGPFAVGGGVDVAVGNGGKIVERVRDATGGGGSGTETPTETTETPAGSETGNETTARTDTRTATATNTPADSANASVPAADRIATLPIAPRRVDTYLEGVWV